MILNNNLKQVNARSQSFQMTPHSVRKQYLGVEQDASQELVSNPQIVYVYCSPHIKVVVSFLWKFILFAYIVAIPVFVYILHKENDNNNQKLHEIAMEYDAHIRPSKIIENHTRVRRGMPSLPSIKKAQEMFKKEYLTPTKQIEENTQERINDFKVILKRYEKRYEFTTRVFFSLK